MPLAKQSLISVLAEGFEFLIHVFEESDGYQFFLEAWSQVEKKVFFLGGAFRIGFEDPGDENLQFIEPVLHLQFDVASGGLQQSVVEVHYEKFLVLGKSAGGKIVKSPQGGKQNENQQAE